MTENRATLLAALMGTNLAVCVAFALPLDEPPAKVDAGVIIYCLPGDDPMPRFVANCRKAGVIRVQEYNLTLPEAGDALIAAKKRGADVKVLLDRSQETDGRSQARRLHEAGIPVLIDHRHAISHLKLTCWDDDESMGGSMNVTRSGLHANAELAVFVLGKEPNAVLLKNWDKHAAHALPFSPVP